MSSEGDAADRAKAVGLVATKLFATPMGAAAVIPDLVERPTLFFIGDRRDE
jgi:hypothetical protein